MATKTYIKNPFVSVDGHDLSAYVKQATVTRQKDELDVTASGDGGHTQIPGLSKDQFVFDLYQDADMSVVNRIISDIYEGETAVVVECCQAGSVVSESNPSFTGNAKVYQDQPISSAVGAVAMQSVTFAVDGAITRSGT